MIPFVCTAVMEGRCWLKKEDLRLGLSFCSAIPGPTVMQWPPSRDSGYTVFSVPLPPTWALPCQPSAL